MLNFDNSWLVYFTSQLRNFFLVRFGQSCIAFMFFLMMLRSLHKNFSCFLQTAALCSGHPGPQSHMFQIFAFIRIQPCTLCEHDGLWTAAQLWLWCGRISQQWEEQKELMITVWDIWRGKSVCSLSVLWSDSQDVAEVEALIHLTADSLQRTSLKGSHAAFRVGCALLCPPAGYGKIKYKRSSGLRSSVGTWNLSKLDWSVVCFQYFMFVQFDPLIGLISVPSNSLYRQRTGRRLHPFIISQQLILMAMRFPLKNTGNLMWDMLCS